MKWIKENSRLVISTLVLLAITIITGVPDIIDMGDGSFVVGLFLFSIVFAVILFDIIKLKGKIITFIASIVLYLVMSPVYIVGLICKLVDWIKEKQQ